jgi:hypothetical protein
MAINPTLKLREQASLPADTTGVTAKGSPLTNAEVDANFVNLRKAVNDVHEKTATFESIKVISIPNVNIFGFGETFGGYDNYTIDSVNSASAIGQYDAGKLIRFSSANPASPKDGTVFYKLPALSNIVDNDEINSVDKRQTLKLTNTAGSDFGTVNIVLIPSGDDFILGRFTPDSKTGALTDTEKSANSITISKGDYVELGISSRGDNKYGWVVLAHTKTYSDSLDAADPYNYIQFIVHVRSDGTLLANNTDNTPSGDVFDFPATTGSEGILGGDKALRFYTRRNRRNVLFPGIVVTVAKTATGIYTVSWVNQNNTNILGAEYISNPMAFVSINNLTDVSADAAGHYATVSKLGQIVNTDLGLVSNITQCVVRTFDKDGDPADANFSIMVVGGNQ